ncbi:peptide ABC transporter permease [Rhodococcus sp. 1163]|uniref:ABC transporter permease n=1 Tax=Rhodococcus sp. 1163 TaxID=1905289 RepID=UPI000A0009D2|nr:ABC transporter permease [Rhodococcus sp. 1163]ORI18831.1 peptide ABC transporter permease [Rhodococcus sp. 1163]
MSDLRDASGDLVRPRRPAQGSFVAGPTEVEVAVVDSVDDSEAPSGFWRDAWVNLRKSPLFIISGLLILFILVVVVFPGWFTSQDPRYCNGDFSMAARSGGHPFGFDLQGCDIYARTVYGARASVLVGVGATFAVLLFGGTLGALAGFYGGWLDSLLSRVTDIFFGIPLILGAIVLLQVLRDRNVWVVIGIIAIFGWPQIARITRGSVLSISGNDFVMAAKALGVSRFKTLLRHVIPNALGPIVVTTTITLGVFVTLEATLSYLGVGLPGTVVSWGADISTGQSRLRSGSPILFYPATALAITVLAFMMMGDALRDALDPKARKR